MSLAQRVILIVWDGTRPDFVTPDLTPHLCALARDGAHYERATGVFPSVTRPTTSSVSTSTSPATHGVISNRFTGPPGNRAPIDTGDRQALERLRAIHAGRIAPPLTLAEALVAAGRRVVLLGSGSTGQVTLLDPERVGTTIHTGFTWPASLHETLVARFGPPPAKTIPVQATNDWLTRVLTDYVLPDLEPDLVVCWLCEPDATQHAQGLGSPAALAAIRGNDARLGRLLAAIDVSGVPTTVLVASDHGHSTVTGMVRTRDSLSESGFAAALTSGQIVLADEAVVIEDCPGAESLRAALGDWLAEQPWVGALIDWNAATQSSGATLTPDQIWPGRPRAPLPYAPTFSYSHAWSAVENRHQIPGSVYAGFVASLADFARLQGAIVGLNRLTSTHGTLSPYDQQTMLILAGSGVRPGRPDLPASVLDLAPTILALLGLPALPDAEGRVLVESLTDTTASAMPTVQTDDLAMLPSGRLRRHRVGGTVYLETRFA